MASRFRCPILLVSNKKVAELMDVKIKLASGDEIQIGSEGILGHSDGTEVSSISFSAAVPVAGMSVDLLTILRSKQDVTCGVPVGGQFLVGDYRMTTAEISGQTKNGTCTGSFELEISGPLSAT